MLSLWRSAARCFSSSAARAEAVTYPFSKTALTPPPPAVAPPARASVGKGLMEYLHKTIPTPEKQKMLTELFSRRSPAHLMPGSVLTVTLDHAPTSFTGVLISIRRRGIDTSFVLRNIVQRTGVEMQFFVNSPHLKEIKLVQKPPKGRMRRAKLFYLRTSPDKMSMLAAGRRG
jgi:large subunit ribosomal protein L19